jgi:hypothetical protein
MVDVSVRDGYVHNFQTNRLVSADNEPLDFSLNLSCRQIAHEMEGVALEVNKITFRTYRSDSTWLR